MYNAKNRKEIVDDNIVVVSIDRIKLSFQLNNKHIRGYSRDPLNKYFKYLENVIVNRPLEIGLYYIYKNRKMEEHTVFVGSVPLESSKELIEKRFKSIKKPVKKMKIKGHIFNYSYKTTYEHKEYKIIGFNQKIRITKNKNYLILEINDILQEKPKQTIFTDIRRALEFLVKTKVINYNYRSKDTYCPRYRAYHLLKNIKISEIEIAFDFIYKYGNYFYDVLSQANHNNLEFVQFENTIYWNNSYDFSHRWKWKYYNKSLKDRIDNKSELDEPIEGDIYRFEITVGRNSIANILTLNDLKHKQPMILSLLKNRISIGFTHFFKQFDYAILRNLIEDIRIKHPNINTNNITKKNYIKILKELLIMRYVA